MIELTIDGKPISLTILQAIALQEQIAAQLRIALTPVEPTMLSTAEAIALARKKGARLPATTLRTALEAGKIQGAQKGTRYQIPEHEFLKWLARYLDQE